MIIVTIVKLSMVGMILILVACSNGLDSCLGSGGGKKKGRGGRQGHRGGGNSRCIVASAAIEGYDDAVLWTT